MNANPLIAPLIQAFFQHFLVARRGLSSNTIVAYRDCLKLFLNFAAGRLQKPVDKLTVEDFQDKLVVGFLDDLETSRGNSTRTRNARLARPCMPCSATLLGSNPRPWHAANRSVLSP